MTSRGSFVLRVAALLCGVPLGAGLCAPVAPANSEIRSLAATCAACHGTDGHAVAGSRMPRLAGMPKADFVRQMRAFRDGTREATVMQQIAKGYGDAQTEALGGFFAAQR
jgi:cytochrome c553